MTGGQPSGLSAATVALVVIVAVVAGSTGLAVAANPDRQGAVDDDGAAHHPTPAGDADPETRVVENGSVVNANAEALPPGCEAVRGERRLTIDAGREYATAGEAFGYDLDTVTAPACTRLVVTLVNHDDVRHQWVVDGLPTATYPGGYVAIEVADRGSVTAAFVTPSQSGTYEGLSTLPQHEQNGMRLPLVVAGGQSAKTTTATTADTDESVGSAPGLSALLVVLALSAAVLLAARQ